MEKSASYMGSDETVSGGNKRYSRETWGNGTGADGVLPIQVTVDRVR